MSLTLRPASRHLEYVGTCECLTILDFGIHGFDCFRLTGAFLLLIFFCNGGGRFDFWEYP
jgi:hypothetical protein